ncbi:MAG: hypothetical protein IH859_08535 [Chloroflexi bacterium]|nr:hypothetical protein [Chloroflexota bacterium]
MTDEISMGNVGKTGSLQLSQNIDNLEIIDVETLIIFNSLTTERSLWDIKINARATMIIESNSIILFQFTETLFIDSVIVNNFLSPSHTTQNGDITSIEITLITEINQNETMHISLSGMVQHELSNIDDQLWLFKYKWGFNFPIPKMNLSIHLPPSSGVSGQLDLLDIFPGGYSLITDGKIIIINSNFI